MYTNTLQKLERIISEAEAQQNEQTYIMVRTPRFIRYIMRRTASVIGGCRGDLGFKGSVGPGSQTTYSFSPAGAPSSIIASKCYGSI